LSFAIPLRCRDSVGLAGSVFEEEGNIAILSLDRRHNLAIISLVKTIILTLSAAKDLDALPRDAREQVEAGLHRYAMTGQGDVKALQGRGGYRLRIGNYRVIFDEDAATILAIYIGRRATTTYKRS
jgi:mRNA interferase RelE/StbE